MSGAMSALSAGFALSTGPLAFGQVTKKSVPARGFSVPFKAQQSSAFYFQRETFQPYVGGVFTIHSGARSVKATLREVRDCTPSPMSTKLTTKAPQKSDSFALVFQTAGVLADATTIYTVEHAALGKFDLFLTSRSPAQGTYVYEAVINHLL